MSQSATDDLPKYNPADRLAPPPESSPPIRGIEISFAIDTHLTREQWERLRELVIEITEAPCNTPKEGVHWLFSEGCKPLWREPEEPDFDTSVHTLESAARGFVTAEERQRKQARR